MLRTLSLFFALLCAAAPAGAAGVVTFSWDGCSGPVSKTVLPGSKSILYASLIGQSESHTGYQVRVRVGTSCSDPGSPPIPDAWRFDFGGCQPSGSFHVDDAAPPEEAAACPTFRAQTGLLYEVRNYSYDATTGRGSMDLLVAYDLGVVVPANPAQRYFLGRFIIDQGQGIVGPSAPGFCGGLETPLCLQPFDLQWLNATGDGRTWETDTPCLTVNDPAHTSGCNVSTPARATTWGAIRGQYR